MPIRCAKCKTFGHECAKILKTLAHPSQGPNEKIQQSDDVWLKQGKGKNIVVECVPPTSQLEQTPMATTTVREAISQVQELLSKFDNTFSRLNGKVSHQAEDVKDPEVINFVNIIVANGVPDVVTRNQGRFPIEKNKISLLEDADTDIPS